MIMKQKWMIGICVAAVLVIAHTSVGGEKKKGNESTKHDDARRVLSVAKTDLLAAVKTAQKSVSDGKVFCAVVDEQSGKPLFQIHALVGNKIKHVEVDAITGKVLKSADDDDKDANDVKDAKAALDKTRITLVSAIEAALKGKNDASAFEAKIGLDEGTTDIGVEYFEGSKIIEAKIDPGSGMVTKTNERK
jgi:uncharacterized membrane protein YkoI